MHFWFGCYRNPDFVTKGRSVTHLKDLDNALDAADRHRDARHALYGGDRGPVPRPAGPCDLDHAGLLVELERRNDIAAPSRKGTPQ
jgi:hypothetical protein